MASPSPTPAPPAGQPEPRRGGKPQIFTLRGHRRECGGFQPVRNSESHPSKRWRGALIPTVVLQNKVLHHIRTTTPHGEDWRQYVTQGSLQATRDSIGDTNLKNAAEGEIMRGIRFWNLTENRIEIVAIDVDGTEMTVDAAAACNSQYTIKLVRLCRWVRHGPFD